MSLYAPRPNGAPRRLVAGKRGGAGRDDCFERTGFAADFSPEPGGTLTLLFPTRLMHATLGLAVFTIVSIPIASVSWPSLRNPRSHSFLRFFAFELLVVLILLNLPRWFSDPFSARQLVSWLFLLISLLLPVHGFYLLRKVGRPRGGIERTTALVTVGAYKYIRHLVYASLLWGAWGIFLKEPSLLGGILALACSVFAVVTARIEEAENLGKFGSEYATYMKRTTRFVPFTF